MKKSVYMSIVAFIFLIFAFSAYATTYYVSTSGLDTNNGLSTSAPIKTIAKVNKLNLAPGDSVLFKRGDRWDILYDTALLERSGSSAGKITYGAYGTGNKPIFTRSMHANTASSWKSEGGNIWSTTFTINDDVGLIIFNNEASWGNKKSTLDSCSAQGDFYYDSGSGTTYLYSASNPGTYYSQVELSKKGNIFDIVGGSYIQIQDLDLRYSAKNAIITVDSHDMYFTNLDIRFIGGSYQTGTLRYGNGIEATGDVNNIHIENCILYQIYDAGVSDQDQTDATHDGIYYSNNIISNTRYCFEFINKGTNAVTRNIVFDHNTCYNSGASFGGQSQGYHIRTGQQRGEISNFKITNNIFSKSLTDAVLIDDIFSTAGLQLDYNLYYEPATADNLINWQSDVYKCSDFSSYQSGVGKDSHSKVGDPLFTNANSRTFTLQSSSPACKMSSSGSYVGALPCSGNPPPSPTCGDNACNGAETCTSCPGDCGTCPIVPVCGDKVCNGAETCTSCAGDCGTCPVVPKCGDKVCNGAETCSSCAGDCGTCPIVPVCGDKVCNGKENCSTCSGDCGTCPIVPVCGDKVCNGKENCTTCAGDCGACPTPGTAISACTLGSKSWNEDNSLKKVYDLTACFKDPLNMQLSFKSTGNSSIKITINNGMVDLSSPLNWFGSEQVRFVATAGNRTAYTNTVTLRVNSIADCGDGLCEAGETCNGCAADCGTCPVTPPSGGGGGSGGGGSGGGGGTPVVPPLDESWECEAWSQCIDGQQTQVCVNVEQQMTRTDSQACEIAAPIADPAPEAPEQPVTVEQIMDPEQFIDAPIDTQTSEAIAPEPVLPTEDKSSNEVYQGITGITKDTDVEEAKIMLDSPNEYTGRLTDEQGAVQSTKSYVAFIIAMAIFTFVFARQYVKKDKAKAADKSHIARQHINELTDYVVQSAKEGFSKGQIIAALIAAECPTDVIDAIMARCESTFQSISQRKVYI